MDEKSFVHWMHQLSFENFDRNLSGSRLPRNMLGFCAGMHRGRHVLRLHQPAIASRLGQGVQDLFLLTASDIPHRCEVADLIQRARMLPLIYWHLSRL